MATGVAYEDIETWTIMEASSSIVQMHSYIRKRRAPAQDSSSSPATVPATNTTKSSPDVKSGSAADNTAATGEEAVSYTTSDAADEGLGVDLGGRRIIKKKKK